MRFLFLILCGVMKWNWSVISRCSCSEPAAVLCVQAGFSPSAWRFMEVLRPCLSTGGLCCFVLLQLTLWTDPTPQLSVCPSGFYFAARLSVNCLCFLWLFSHSLTVWSQYFCPSFTLLLSLCPSYLSDSVFVYSPPPPSDLSCAVAACRSDQDRWCQMISGLYSFLQETAWYCCWHEALSGCLQVQKYPNAV